MHFRVFSDVPMIYSVCSLCMNKSNIFAEWDKSELVPRALGELNAVSEPHTLFSSSQRSIQHFLICNAYKRVRLPFQASPHR